MIGTGYELVRAFYAEVEQNESMQVNCKSHHQSLYTWVCELRNRTKREILDLPVLYTMQMTFIGSQHTLSKAIDDLAEWGIIEVLLRTKGQGTKVKIAFAFLQKHCNSDAIEQEATIAEMQIERNSDAIAVQTIKRNKREEKGKKKDIKTSDLPQETEKVNYRENVRLKLKEHEALVEKYGLPFVDRCLDKLSNYKLSHGKEYKSDYGAINSWVVGEIEKASLRSASSANGHPITPPSTVSRPIQNPNIR